jgi:cytochrome c-type biogenesis protein CcmF
MVSLAGFSLFLAFLCAVVATVAGLYGLVNRDSATLLVLKRSLYLFPFLVGFPTGFLVYQFVYGWHSTGGQLGTNFSYVASNASADLDLFYQLSALWAGQSGSLLFWSFVLSLYGLLVVLQLHNKPLDRFNGGTFFAMVVIQGFFLYVLNWVTYPFTRLWQRGGEIMEAAAQPAGATMAYVQGSGLNPVLQHPGMAIHPPTLYLGYIGLSVPFCFAVGALVSGQLGDKWLRQSRIWTLLSWTILSFGIVLGGWWAYQELGWGGYWAWDPVENASFMPWLMATAFVHSVMVQERRGMLKRWNMILVCLAFVLSIFGTFLTRSGLLNSVHTFAEDPVVGSTFMGFLAVLLASIIGLTLWRFDELSADHHLESIFSKEFAFLLNNMLLSGICFAVLWGTMYPIISEAVTGQRISLGPAYYNQVTIPMFLGLLLMSGVGPLISWRKASLENLWRNFVWPVVIGLATAITLVGFGFYRWLPILSFSICSFVLVTIWLEFYRGTMARKRSTGEPFPLALVRLTWKARRRFGGYIVHFGILMMAVGITASSAYQLETQATLQPGETTSVRGYDVRYTSLSCSVSATGEDCLRNQNLFRQCGDSKRCRVSANLVISSGQRRLAQLQPGMELLTTSNQPRARVDIRSTLRDDLYFVLSGWTGEREATLKIYHNPLVNLIWLGVMVLVFGGLYAFLPID